MHPHSPMQRHSFDIPDPLLVPIPVGQRRHVGVQGLIRSEPSRAALASHWRPSPGPLDRLAWLRRNVRTLRVDQPDRDWESENQTIVEANLKPWDQCLNPMPLALKSWRAALRTRNRLEAPARLSGTKTN